MINGVGGLPGQPLVPLLSFRLRLSRAPAGLGGFSAAQTNQRRASAAGGVPGGRKSDGVAPGTYLLLLHNAVTFIAGFVLAEVQGDHSALCHFQLPSLSICPPLCFCFGFGAVKICPAAF